jgi:hypothetical protein
MTMSQKRIEVLADSIAALTRDRRIDLAGELLRAGEMAIPAMLLLQVLDELTCLRQHTKIEEPDAARVALVLDRFGVQPSRSLHETVLVLQQVSRYRLSTSTERELHAELERLFETLLPFEDIKHEYSCERIYRLDFYIPRFRLGIEVKVAGSADEVARQLEGYAKSSQIQWLVLITAHLRHVSQLVQTGRITRPSGPTDQALFFVGGKPLTIIPIGGQLL